MRRITRRRPFQRVTLRDQKTVLALLHHRAIGQLLQRHRQRVQAFLAVIEPFAMQHGVHLFGADTADAVALLPRGAEALGVVAAAIEARTMAGCERGRFIEEEQLGPASLAHHLAPASAELAEAGDPGWSGPALSQERLARGVMDDAAVAGEQPAMRRCDDVACRRDAVLQWHQIGEWRVANGE